MPFLERRSEEFLLRTLARPEDIDELGHVSNIVYVRWVQDVAVAHSASVGFTHEKYRHIGGIFVARRHEVDYLSSALQGDGIELRTWIAGWSAVTSVRKTVIRRVSDGKELAQASTTWAFVSTTTGRPQRIPQQVIDAFFPSEAVALP